MTGKWEQTQAVPGAFRALLTPHRSLGPTGFLVLMAALAGISFITGLVFFLAGAWPVMGFFGLDVLLVYIAFKVSYRSAAAYEQVTMTPSTLTVRKVSHRGKVAEWTLNPVWVRLQREENEEFGLERLFLVSHGRRLPVATFLGPEENANFASALLAALGEARRGPTRTVVH
jgi:uncharacterized membrane protein